MLLEIALGVDRYTHRNDGYGFDMDNVTFMDTYTHSIPYMRCGSDNGKRSQ